MCLCLNAHMVEFPPKLLKHFLIIADAISFTGKANENFECLLITVNMSSYLEEGMGPLKSIDSL